MRGGHSFQQNPQELTHGVAILKSLKKPSKQVLWKAWLLDSPNSSESEAFSENKRQMIVVEAALLCTRLFNFLTFKLPGT